MAFDLLDFNTDVRRYILEMVEEEYVTPKNMLNDIIAQLTEKELRVLLTIAGHTPTAFD